MIVELTRKVQNLEAGSIVEVESIGGNFMRVTGEDVVLHPNQWVSAVTDEVLEEIVKDWEFNYGEQ